MFIFVDLLTKSWVCLVRLTQKSKTAIPSNKTQTMQVKGTLYSIQPPEKKSIRQSRKRIDHTVLFQKITRAVNSPFFARHHQYLPRCLLGMCLVTQSSLSFPVLKEENLPTLEFSLYFTVICTAVASKS